MLAVLLAMITENVVPADVTSRIKDAIIRKAENVFALEVENVLATHPCGRRRRSHRNPHPAPASGFAPSWYPPQQILCHWNPLDSKVVRKS